LRQDLYPLTFIPVFRDYLWGGRNLEALYGRALPPGIVAESWEISGHPSSPTVVEAGYWRGRALPEVLAALGEELVGRNNRAMLARGRFPLLVKLLDANAPLSVQVHPDDAYAQAHEGGEPGKTELWYVLHAKPGAALIYGLAQEVTREAFLAALQAGNLERYLQRLPVAAGDAIFIAAGTVHALLAGIVVAEIQQNSDTTYRVYDWGRLGADGKPRPLHVDKALEVINLHQAAPGKVAPAVIEARENLRRALLARCPQFTVERVELAAGGEFAGRCEGATFEIWGCVAGRGTLHWAGAPVALPAVRFVLLPAMMGEYAVRAEEASTFLRAYVEAER